MMEVIDTKALVLWRLGFDRRLLKNMKQDAEITQLLVSARGGDNQAQDELIAQVYAQLRVIARHQVRRVGGSPTLCTTAVVNEAYLKLFGKQDVNWENRQHFFACASLAMRQLLIDYARRRQAGKRSAEVPMPTVVPQVGETVHLNIDELLGLDEALTHLQATDERLGRLVELRFFSGLNVEEVSLLMQCSTRTVVRDWRRARAFLNASLVA